MKHKNRFLEDFSSNIKKKEEAYLSKNDFSCCLNTAHIYYYLFTNNPLDEYNNFNI
jgi:hypothetical protein